MLADLRPVRPDPPFTTSQLKALVTPDIFEVIDWPGIFGVGPRRCAMRSTRPSGSEPTSDRVGVLTHGACCRPGRRSYGPGCRLSCAVASATSDLARSRRGTGRHGGPFRPGGPSIERFYHFICKSDEPTFDLMRELGIGDKVRWRRTSMGYFMTGRYIPGATRFHCFVFRISPDREVPLRPADVRCHTP